MSAMSARTVINRLPATEAGRTIVRRLTSVAGSPPYRDPFSEYQSIGAGSSTSRKGKARERTEQPDLSDDKPDDLALAFRHDLHARMMTSPVRKCAVTGAKLPRDFLLCLRPATYPPNEDPDSSNDPREGNIYLVPDKILDPKSNDKLGKGLWLFCHRGLLQTFLDKPGSVKRISSSAAVSKLLPFHAESQLQTKIQHDFLRLISSRAKSISSVSLADVERLRGGEDLKSGLLAVLDTRGMTADPIERPDPRDLLQGEQAGFPAVPLYPVWTETTSRTSLPDRIVPVYELGMVLPRYMHKPIMDALHSAGCSSAEGYIAISSTPQSFPAGKDNPALELCKSLWRLRLFHGQGWTGEDSQDETGLVVHGFEERMEGKMHGKIA